MLGNVGRRGTTADATFSALCKDRDLHVLAMKVLTVTPVQTSVPLLLPASLNAFTVPFSPRILVRNVTLEKPSLLHFVFIQHSLKLLSLWSHRPPAASSQLNPTSRETMPMRSPPLATRVWTVRTHHLYQPLFLQ